MTYAVNPRSPIFFGERGFQKFVFIGDTSVKVAEVDGQLHQNLNSDDTLSRTDIGNSLLITQIQTRKSIIQQLKNLQLKPGKVVQLLSKTGNGSVVVSFDNRLVGIGSEIAQKIIVTLAS